METEFLEQAGPEGVPPELAWARRQPLPYGQKYPLEVLAGLSIGRRSPARGFCEVDRPWLAKRCGMGVSTVRRALRALVDIGLLSEWPLPGTDGSLFRVNLEAGAIAKPMKSQAPRGVSLPTRKGTPPNMGAPPMREGTPPNLGGHPSQSGGAALSTREGTPPGSALHRGVVRTVTRTERVSQAGQAPPDGRTALAKPELPNSEPHNRERRKASRGKGVAYVACRDLDARGRPVAGTYAVSPEQLAALKETFPRLDETAQQQGECFGVRECLKTIEGHYRGKRDLYELRERRDVPRRIATWLDQETAKLAGRDGKAKQLPLHTGTEG